MVLVLLCGSMCLHCLREGRTFEVDLTVWAREAE